MTKLDNFIGMMTGHFDNKEQFDEMQKMVKRMKKMQNGKKGGLFGGMKLPFMH